MFPDAALPVPASLMTLLAVFAPLFTAPSFRTFSMLACGFLAQSGKRTVCGMLTGAGLSRIWPHDRAHYFFSRARWNPGELGIAAAKLVIALLVPGGEPVEILIDDTLFRRRGKVFFPRRLNSVSSMATRTGSPAGTSSVTTSSATARPRSSAHQRARAKNPCARLCGQVRVRPAPASMPHTVRLPACARNPQANSMVKVRNDGAVNSGAKDVSNPIREAGTGSVASGSIGGNAFHQRLH